MLNRTCRVCFLSKNISEYHIDKSKKHGIRNICKECAKIQSSAYYLKNANKLKVKVSVYRKTYTPRFNREIDSRLRALRTKAKQRIKKEFNIQESELLDAWGKQKGLCTYTKLPLTAKANQFNTVSLDRTDSSKGYIVGNIQLVCAAVNKMKQEYTEEVFLLFCHLVSQNNELSDTPESLLARLSSVGTLDLSAPSNVSL
jgi:hypothetical protein